MGADLLGNDPSRWQTSIQEAWSRLLYVAHAVNCYYPKEYVRPSTREGEVFLRTQKSAKQLLDKLDVNTTKEWDLLRSARLKLQVGSASYSACGMSAPPCNRGGNHASVGKLPDLTCCIRLLDSNCVLLGQGWQL